VPPAVQLTARNAEELAPAGGAIVVACDQARPVAVAAIGSVPPAPL